MKTLFFSACIFFLWPGVKSNHCGTRCEAVNTSAQKNKITADTTSINGPWFLQPLFVADTATGKIPSLQINLTAGTFSGNTGCNNMHGSFQKTDSSLAFNQNIVTTKMTCTGYNEAAFLKSLLQTNRYKIEKGILILMFDETELSRWTRKPDRKVKMNKA